MERWEYGLAFTKGPELVTPVGYALRSDEDMGKGECGAALSGEATIGQGSPTSTADFENYAIPNEVRDGSAPKVEAVDCQTHGSVRC